MTTQPQDTTGHTASVDAGAPEPPAVADGPTAAGNAAAGVPGAPDRDGDRDREAQKYRRRAQAAETERDQLAERLTVLQRDKVEQIAGERLQVGNEIWLPGTDLADLLDADGNVDPGKVRAAADAIVAERPHWRAPTSAAASTSEVTGNGRIGGDDDDDFVSAFRPREA